MSSTFPGPITDRVDLLILQPTPFCNIDCDYCYLQSRTSTKKMPLTTINRALESVLESGLVRETLTVVWHAGEPLAMPAAYYEEALPKVDAKASGVKILHAMQTNGTLINDRWCDLFRRHSVNVGVSIDGPAFLHDRHRKDRQGLGTHVRVMRGIECLQRNKIPFHAIAVVTEDSLQNPDEVFEFFQDLGATTVGFNIEEVEGCHNSTTLASCSGDIGVDNFFRRIYQLQKESTGNIRIREFERSFQAIASAMETAPDDGVLRNHQVLPFGIVSIDWAGNVSTFSPELLDASDSQGHSFVFGNILSEDLVDILNNARFIEVASAIHEGVRKCARDCECFPFCFGGAPANKYFENGTFSSTETMYCRHTIQLPLQIVLSDLEAELRLPPHQPSVSAKRETFLAPAVSEKLIQIRGHNDLRSKVESASPRPESASIA